MSQDDKNSNKKINGNGIPPKDEIPKNNPPMDPMDELFAIMNEYRTAKPNQESIDDDENDTADSTKKIVIPQPSDADDNMLTGHFTTITPITTTKQSDGQTHELNIEAHLISADDVVIPASATENLNNHVPKKSNLPIYKKIWSVITHLSFLSKAIIYVLIVLIISAYTSYYAITIANDVFAFVKNDREFTLTIPENATKKEICFLLKKNDIIKYDWMFNLYLIYKEDDEDTKFLSGEKIINSKMNYNQIIAALTTTESVREQVNLTIPEGFTVDDIIDLFVKSGIGTKEGFVEAINKYPFKHEFVTLLDTNGYPATRKYRLEGYLYPDTYFFYKDTPEYLIINKMLNNFDQRFWTYYKSTFKNAIEKTGKSVDEIITLASMIQAEARFYIDYESVSYVFWNRLNHVAAFPFLQSDATIQYVLPKRNEDLTQEDLDLNNPYNTYVYKGLPPGAICNPGFDALSAAIYPDAPINSNGASVNAYFFVSNKAGVTYYAETKAQHEKNKRTVAEDNVNFEKHNN